MPSTELPVPGQLLLHIVPESVHSATRGRYSWSLNLPIPQKYLYVEEY